MKLRESKDPKTTTSINQDRKVSSLQKQDKIPKRVKRGTHGPYTSAGAEGRRTGGPIVWLVWPWALTVSGTHVRGGSCILQNGIRVFRVLQMELFGYDWATHMAHPPRPTACSPLLWNHGFNCFGFWYFSIYNIVDLIPNKKELNVYFL